MSKEKKQKKKIEKDTQKRIKELSTILDWMDIQTINDDGISIAKGLQEEIVKGIKIEPKNIMLLATHEKDRALLALTEGFNNIRFPLYLKIVKEDTKLEPQIVSLTNKWHQETNRMIRHLIEIQLRKLDWFIENQKEISFYAMVHDSSERIDKKLEIVTSCFSQAGLVVKPMNQQNYVDAVKQEFQNETVNEYIFSKLLTDAGGQ